MSISNVHPRNEYGYRRVVKGERILPTDEIQPVKGGAWGPLTGSDSWIIGEVSDGSCHIRRKHEAGEGYIIVPVGTPVMFGDEYKGDDFRVVEDSWHASSGPGNGKVSAIGRITYRRKIKTPSSPYPFYYVPVPPGSAVENGDVGEGYRILGDHETISPGDDYCAVHVNDTRPSRWESAEATVGKTVCEARKWWGQDYKVVQYRRKLSLKSKFEAITKQVAVEQTVAVQSSINALLFGLAGVLPPCPPTSVSLLDLFSTAQLQEAIDARAVKVKVKASENFEPPLSSPAPLVFFRFLEVGEEIRATDELQRGWHARWESCEYWAGKPVLYRPLSAPSITNFRRRIKFA